MVSSVSSNAALSSAMLSGSQCRGPRDAQAFQEKLFSKLDVDGNGSIDQSELSQFVNFAASSTSSTSATSDSGAADLFKSMDTDGDGTLSKTELADGAKKLFDELRTQLMSASGGLSAVASTSGTSSSEATDGTSATNALTSAPTSAASSGGGSTGAASTDATSANGASADATQGPAPGRHHHHGGGGMFAKIASLIDQYRSTATDSADATAEASTLSVAA